jgi:hypothetical protein
VLSWFTSVLSDESLASIFKQAILLFSADHPFQFSSRLCWSVWLNRILIADVEHAQVVLRFAFLIPLSLSGLVKVAPASVLLTVQKTSLEYPVIINDLPLLTYCESFCYICLCWCWPLLTCVTARNTMSKWSKDRSGANVSYQTRTETFPARPSFGYQCNLPVLYLSSWIRRIRLLNSCFFFTIYCLLFRCKKWELVRIKKRIKAGETLFPVTLCSHTNERAEYRHKMPVSFQTEWRFIISVDPTHYAAACTNDVIFHAVHLLPQNFSSDHFQRFHYYSPLRLLFW